MNLLVGILSMFLKLNLRSKMLLDVKISSYLGKTFSNT